MGIVKAMLMEEQERSEREDCISCGESALSSEKAGHCSCGVCGEGFIVCDECASFFDTKTCPYHVHQAEKDD